MGIKAVEDSRLTAALPKLIEIVGDAKKAEAERLAAVKALRVLNDKRATGALNLLLNGKDAAALKAEALRALAAIDVATARATAEKLLDLMEQLNQKEGATFLFSTHDPRVMARARRLLRMVDGQVVSDERR